MNYFDILNWYSSLGLILSVVIGFAQRTPKRQIAVFSLYLSLISPLMAYAFFTTRQELPGFSPQYDAVMAAFGPLASILIYSYGCRMLHRVEQRAAKRRTVIDGSQQIEGEKPAEL